MYKRRVNVKGILHGGVATPRDQHAEQGVGGEGSASSNGGVLGGSNMTMSKDDGERMMNVPKDGHLFLRRCLTRRSFVEGCGLIRPMVAKIFARFESQAKLASESTLFRKLLMPRQS